MCKPILVKLVCFVLGVVVGGGVVFGIIKLTGNSSSDGNGTSDTPGTRANSTLKYLIAVSRHGNKNTAEDYPLDPYPGNNTEYWPYGRGQLTPHGRSQEYKLGVKLRSLYNGFLNTTFFTEDVFACTDLYERTMMSGELVLAGLYPPQGWQVWNQDVNWQPIPLYTNSSDHTKVIYSCPSFLNISAITTDEFLAADAVNVTELINYVYNYTGQTLTPDDLTYMYEKLKSEVTEGYTLPDWTKNLYPSPLDDYNRKQFIASCACTDETVRLWIGNFLSDLVDTLNDAASGLTSRSLSYFSAHDASILNLQVALGMPRDSIIVDINTGSALLIELHQDSDSSPFNIQVLYIDGASLDADPLALSLPDCGNPCYFDTFLNSTKRYYTDVNYDQECLENFPTSL